MQPDTVRNDSAAAAGAACVRWRDERDTAAFALALARQPQLRNAFIELRGELGAGKTTLVRHILRALGFDGRVKSPTYTIVEPYRVGNFHIWHFDFYRFSDPQEWEDAGFRDIFAASGLKLAEWPERVAGVAPAADLAISIEVLDENARQVTLHALNAAAHALVKAVVPA